MDNQPCALLHPDILDTIFEKLEWKELMTAREVCKTWYSTSEKYWLEKCPIKVLYYSKYRKNSVDLVEAFRGHVMRNAETYWHGAVRYKKFYLGEFSFSQNWFVDSVFWSDFGYNLTYLQLGYCKVSCDDACRQLLYCTTTPSLRSLTLNGVEYPHRRGMTHCLPDMPMENTVTTLRNLVIYYSSDYQLLPLTWRSMFQRYPCLEVLELEHYSTGDVCEIGRILEGIRSFSRTSGGKHSLKSLRLDTKQSVLTMPFPESLLEHFRIEFMERITPSLELQKLSFALSPNTPEVNQSYEIVDNQRNSLQDLRIRGFEKGSRNLRKLILLENFNLPEMKHLTRLDLWDCKINALGFLLNLPNLKNLNLVFHSCTMSGQKARWNIIQDDILPTWGPEQKCRLSCPSLVSFSHNLVVNWETGDITRLATWFPNLESLLIHGTDTSFPEICKRFRKLRRLFLFHSLVNHDIFTGFTTAGRHLVEGGDISIGAVERNPNITDLKELEYLVIHRFNAEKFGATGYPPGRLSAFAVREGLLKVNKLRKLHVSYNGICELGMRALAERFKGEVFMERRFGRRQPRVPDIVEFVS